MSAWIFLRGLTRESRHWGSFPATFYREIPAARVHTPDLPGNGALYAERSPGQVAEMVESYRSRLLGQGIAPPYYLLGMSLGAMVAVAWAARHPQEIRGCVLINTSLRPFSPFYQRLKPASYHRLLQLALPGGSDEARERTILELTSRQVDLPVTVLQSWVAWRRECPVDSANALRQLLAAMCYRAPLVRPQSAMLILASRNDALVDSACSRQLALRWDTAFAQHPSAGHDLPLDDAAWVARQVSHWLATVA